jgi:hypothetical protein
MEDYHDELPEEFYSDETNAPFTRCTVCDSDLIDSGVPYSIEKAIKVLASGDEVTLYEMAICLPCSHKMNERVSEESRKVMEEFFAEMQMEKKQWELMINNLHADPSEKSWLKQCLISGKLKSEFTEYNMVAQMMGSRMMPGMQPFVIDSKAMEGLQDKLSAETKEEFDDFRDKFLAPTDPELRALFQESSFVFF